MATWTTFTEEAPEMAALATRRFTATGLAMIATLRSDGFPRISPVEPTVEGDRLLLHDGHLVLGMMHHSTKALDLRRDPRYGLHTATADKEVTDGDAKFWGRAIEVTDHDTLEQVADTWLEVMGWRPQPGRFHVFLPDLLGASTVQGGDESLLIDTWKPGEGVTRVVKRD